MFISHDKARATLTRLTLALTPTLTLTLPLTGGRGGRRFEVQR